MAGWATPPQIPIVIRPPTRLVPSGTFTLLANSSTRSDLSAPAFFPGTNNRMVRLQIVITNLDPTLTIKWQTPNGVNCGTIFAQLPFTLEMDADILLYNPNGSNISVEVCELYADVGNLHGVPQRLASQVAGSGAAGQTGQSSGSNGGTSGSFSGGFSGGGRGGSQPP